MTYDESRDFEEWADVAIGALLKRAKEAERYAKQHRELIAVLEAAKSAAWKSNSDEEWTDDY